MSKYYSAALVMGLLVGLAVGIMLAETLPSLLKVPTQGFVEGGGDLDEGAKSTIRTFSMGMGVAGFLMVIGITFPILGAIGRRGAAGSDGR